MTIRVRTILVAILVVGLCAAASSCRRPPSRPSVTVGHPRGYAYAALDPETFSALRAYVLSENPVAKEPLRTMEAEGRVIRILNGTHGSILGRVRISGKTVPAVRFLITSGAWANTVVICARAVLH